MKPQLPSRVPAVIDGLLTIIAESPALVSVQVIDGPVLDLSQIEDDAIAVAPGTDDQPGVMASVTREASLGRNAYLEQVEVVMVLASYSGGTNMKERRTRAAELLAGVKGAVDDNQVRSGAWDEVGMGADAAWFPKQHADGCSVEVTFTIVARSVI